jgi:peptidoglycan hydrolase-like protein with peptidoglycan-binding domain
VDGIVGANTWKALVTTLQLGASGDAVRAVQNELTAHGVSTTVSGSYDATTADHVQQFQVTSGIAPSAKADTTTWQFLVQ